MGESSRLRRGQDGTFLFFCPGCNECHVVYTGRRGAPTWAFNGDMDRPTFSPSVLVRTGRAVDPTFIQEDGDPPEVCHSFIRDGNIQFLADCSHEMAGRIVALPTIDKWYSGAGDSDE